MSYYDDHEFIEVVVKCRHATDEVVEFTGDEIIRCKECKHSPKNTKEIPLHDSCYTFEPDDFCSYGERKE